MRLAAIFLISNFTRSICLAYIIIMAGIIWTDYFIPQNTISVEEEINRSDIAYEEKMKKIEYYNSCSIKTISSWGDTDCVSVMEKMIEKMLRDTGIDPGKVRYIIAANPRKMTFNNVNIPFYIKEKFSMNNSEVLYINEVCASTIVSFGLSEKLVCDTDEYVVILSLHAMDHNERFRNFTVAGDGCAAALIGNHDERFRFVAYNANTYGMSSYNTYPYNKEPETGLKIAKYAVGFIKDIYKNNSVELEDVNCIIAQNTNLMQLDIFKKLLRVKDGYIFTENISKSGHCGDVDTIRNIKDIYHMPKGLYLIYASGLHPSQDIVFSEMLVEKTF